jgi:type II secretory pathway pseudopilin PulG
MRSRCTGHSLPELLVAITLLGLLAVPALRAAGSSLAAQRVESLSRRVGLGLEQGRAAAQRSGRPCALALASEGWREPATGTLPGCAGVEQLLSGEGSDAGVRLRHNLPAAVRFASNGLVLDGGTVVVGAAGTELERCTVISLPLGVVRIGRWLEGECRPDPSL